MLKVKVFMNTVMEEVLSFKCCNLHNQNFEMHVDNLGLEPVMVPSRFVLENETGTLECDHLFPPGGQRIEPGAGAAFYCSMDEAEWGRYRTLTVFDGEGNAYGFSINEITG